MRAHHSIIVFLILGLTTSTAVAAISRSSSEPKLNATNEPDISFTVATVKPASSRSSGWRMEFTPNGFTAHNVTLRTLIEEAWDAYAAGRLVGGPDWLDKSYYDVEAKLDTDEVPRFRELALEARRKMLQSLLHDRFHVSLHTEHREIPTFELAFVKVGPDLRQTPANASLAGDIRGIDSLVTTSQPGFVEGKNFSMLQFARLLEGYTGHIVTDRTQLQGRYDFSLRWSPEELSLNSPKAEESASTDTKDSAPSLFTALKEQLGLKLDARRSTTDVLVVDQAQRPEEN